MSPEPGSAPSIPFLQRWMRRSLLALLMAAAPAVAVEPPRLVVQTGHGGLVSGGVFSRDGGLIASASTDGVRLWDAATGRELRALRHDGTSAFAMAPAGDRVATVGNDRTIRVWDTGTGQEIRALGRIQPATAFGLSGEGQGAEPLLALAFSPDGRRVLAAGFNALRLWDVDGGRELHSVESLVARPEAVAFSPDGRHFAAGFDDGVLRMWPVAGELAPREFKGHAGQVETLRFSPDGRLLASGGEDGSVRLWNARTGAALKTLTGHGSTVTGLAFLGPRTLFSASWDRTVRRWDVETGSAVGEPRLVFDDVVSLDAASDGRLLLGHRDPFLRVWGPEGARPALKLGSFDVLPRGRAALSADGRQLAIVLGDRVRLWDVEAGREVRSVGGDHGYATVAAWTPDGAMLAIGDTRGRLRVWSRETGDLVRESSPHGTSTWINAVAIAPRGGWAATGGADGRVVVFELASGRELRAFAPDGDADVTAVAISPDGRRIAVGSDKAFSLWTAEGRELARIPGRTAHVAFSPDGREIAVVEGDVLGGVLRVRLADDGSVAGRIKILDSARTAAFSPDGSVLATAGYGPLLGAPGYGDRIRLWDIASAAPRGDIGEGTPHVAPETARAELTGHTEGVNELMFAPDGRHLFSASGDGTTRAWRLADRSELARLVSYGDGGWVVADASGRFDTADLESVPGLHWVAPDAPFTPVPVEAFMQDYYEPRLLPRLLAGEVLRPVAPIAGLDRVQPRVCIMSVDPDPAAADRVIVTVEVAGVGPAARDGRTPRTPVHDLRLFRDGQLVGHADGRLAGPGETVRRRFGVRLPRARSGDAVFSAYAFNGDRIKSATDRQRFALPGSSSGARRAVLVNIGVDTYENPAWDLEFAASDARLLAGALEARLRGGGRHAEVDPTLLVSDIDTPEAATKDRIREAFKALVDPGRVGPDDVVLISFSGHGAVDDSGRFHLLPHDIGPGRSRVLTQEVLARGISTDELSEWLRDVDAGEIVLILDACHSAASIAQAGFKPGPMGSRGLGQLAFDKGIRILAATQPNDVALESEATRHGLLSYALVNEGLEARQADFRPDDGRITTAEWLRYAMERVPSLSREVVEGAVASRGSAPRVINGRGLATPSAALGLQQPSLFDFGRMGEGPELQGP